MGAMRFPTTPAYPNPDDLCKANVSILIRFTRIGMKMSLGTYVLLVEDRASRLASITSEKELGRKKSRRFPSTELKRSQREHFHPSKPGGTQSYGGQHSQGDRQTPGDPPKPCHNPISPFLPLPALKPPAPQS